MGWRGAPRPVGAGSTAGLTWLMVSVFLTGACMSTERRPNIDPVVYEQMKQAEAAGTGATLPVVLVLVTPGDSGAPGDLADIERQLAPLVDALRARFTALGVEGAGTVLPLAGGVAIDLTSSQVRALASDALVKRVVSNRTVRAIP